MNSSYPPISSSQISIEKKDNNLFSFVFLLDSYNSSIFMHLQAVNKTIVFNSKIRDHLCFTQIYPNSFTKMFVTASAVEGKKSGRKMKQFNFSTFLTYSFETLRSYFVWLARMFAFIWQPILLAVFCTNGGHFFIYVLIENHWK